MPEDQTTHITTSGGLLSSTFIENVRELSTRQPGTAPETFALPWRDAPNTPDDLEDEIATVWELLLERWDSMRAEFDEMDVSTVRERWLLPLFSLLDFEPAYQRGDTVLGEERDEMRFPLSHRGWNDGGAPVLQLLAPTQKLDDRQGSNTRSVKGKSPHDMLQIFLNMSRPDRWATLANGRHLRLLRDYHHTFTKGYVQFDLESIFETRTYADFRALYRLCHASRFVAPEPAEDADEDAEALSPLEQFYKTALATGIKAGEDLRGQVREAIETLGNGFMSGDGAFIRRLQGDAELRQDYYSEILRVIYRILFLLFAEQRGLLPHAGAELEDLYRSEYSITSLRGRAEGDIPRQDDHTDLWQRLQVLFRMVRDGAEALGVFGYNGMLFDVNGTGGESPLHGRACDNAALLRAIRALTLIEREGVLQRISYADLGVEELGSIYESLLDFTPQVTTQAETVEGREISANTFFLDPRGLERKSTGSYYTHDSLVNELIKSALLPVMRDRLAQAQIETADTDGTHGVGLPVVDEEDLGETTAGLLRDYAGLTEAQRTAGEEALLNITVCDPAAGSGHFLVKANNVLGAELARIRTGDEYPSEPAVQAGKRDALAECIYAVDLNPMAVELCKVSLWINASVRDQPLNFLDHHIKCGNSLIGATPELLEEGVPYDAFALGRPGDDRELAKEIRKQNRQERRDYEKSGGYQMNLPVKVMTEEGAVYRTLREVVELSRDDPKMARERYSDYLTSDAHQLRELEADFWTAAFFWPMQAGMEWAPTFETFMRLRHEGPEVLPEQMIAKVRELADKHKFFHWHVEFEEVFGEDMNGGFDVVLGNPPWEMINLMEKEFFADKAPEIANASTGAKRRKLIGALPDQNLELYQQYQEALHYTDCLSDFLRESGRYELTAQGRINTYQIFAGLARQVVGPRGRVGMVIPSGIATDYYNQDYFSTIVENRELVSLYDFENRDKLFPEVDIRYKFSLLTLTGDKAPAGRIDFAFFLKRTDQLSDDSRHFTLTREDLQRINPNTGTCPTFRNRYVADLTVEMYHNAPVLVNESNETNPWKVSFKQGLFNMTTDSNVFHSFEELSAKGLELAAGARFVRGDRTLLPLYEGRMIHHYDHRTASVGTSDETTFRSGVTIETSLTKHRNPKYAPLPRYWVEADTVDSASPDDYRYKWFVGFKDVTSPTNERTVICAVVPRTAIGNKLPIILPRKEPVLSCGLIANLSSFSLDFVARQKIGGVSLNFYIVKQLPIIPPDRYTSELLAYVVPRVLELTYTAWDVSAFADDVWNDAAQESDLLAAVVQQWEENCAATGGGHANAEPPE